MKVATLTLLVFLLLAESTTSSPNFTPIQEDTELIYEMKFTKEKQEVDKQLIGEFEVTAYDLSVTSTGKTPKHPAYGITASGKSIAGMTWDEARAIAVDPKIIPLGTTVYIEFTDVNYIQYNGYYTAYDTGSAVNGNIIDFFMGDFDSVEANQKTWDFGRTQAKVYIKED